MAVNFGLLQYLLLRYGYELDSWSASSLVAAVNAMHSRHQKVQLPECSSHLHGVGQMLVESEAELTALVCDHFGEIHDIDSLRSAN